MHCAPIRGTMEDTGAHAPQTFKGFGDIMGHTPNFDTEKLRTGAQQLRDAAAVHAGRVAVKATDLAEQGVDWAAPRAQAALTHAIERATPLVEGAAERAQDAINRARPAISHARQTVVDDYLPRASLAVSEAGAALTSPKGTLMERARKAGELSSVALTTPTKPRKRHRFLRAIGWTALGAVVAGAGYVVWKRSQPIEDPWAEEYWADLETDTFVPDVEAESIENTADESSEADTEVQE